MRALPILLLSMGHPQDSCR